MSLSSWSSSEEFQAESKEAAALKWSAFGLEAIGAVIVAASAIYLRIADLHPSVNSLNWNVICNDTSLSYVQYNDDNPILLYLMVLIIPAVFMFILELEHALFSSNPYLQKLSKSERICKSLPRWGRVIAIFITGIFLTSFFADYLMIVLARPRPYFLSKYGINCPSPYNGTTTDDFYYALKSFPSHLACIAGFCCMFAICYAHTSWDTRTTSVLVPIMTQGFVVLALTAGLDGYTSHLNHLWDVVYGLIIGLILAVYMTSLLVEKLPSSTDSRGSKWMDIWNMLIPRARVNLPPTNAEARNATTRNVTARNVTERT